MDESAPAEISEDAMENIPNEGETSPGKDADPSTGAPPNRVFCCRDCGEAFREEAAFLEHCSQHPQDNLCSGDRLDSGGKDCGTPYICTFCSLSFVEPIEFDLHMKNHEQIPKVASGGPINAETMKHPTYECSECGKCYGVIGHFLNHQRSHRTPSKSLFHDLEHLKKKSFQCESCGRSYSRASALDAHRRCHEQKLIKSKNKSSGDTLQMTETIAESKPSQSPAANTSENLFKCVCGKAFSALYRLKTHQRFSRNSQCSPELKQKTKKGLNEFSCHECNKVFNGHLALFNHQRWHANQSHDSSNKFACEECGKVFMTLTFYYRHRRMAHGETPSKSFLHQVCQIQKKAFECKDCGLKFSRASALHAHELHHTDAFREMEKGGQRGSNLLTQEMTPDSGRHEMDYRQISPEEEVKQESLCSVGTTEEPHMIESEDDMESYEPGDFNVQVISASESEGEEVLDSNPDLELLCESDQELRDDGDISHQIFLHKPEMDLKIVQIDFDQADEPSAQTTKEDENKQRFRCPECHCWFPSPSSLRTHRMCHGIHKRRHQIEETEGSIECDDCGLKFQQQEDYMTHLHQHALEEEDGTAEDCGNSAELISWRVEEDEGIDVSSSGITRVQGDRHSSAVNGEPKNYFTCSVCGKIYVYQVSFLKHQKLHENPNPPPKKEPVVEPILPKYECPDCGLKFIRKTRLMSHLRVHRSRRTIKQSIPACEQCNRSFISEKSWMAHLELHRQKPFWCLSCALGFLTEESLDKHLQNHSLKQGKRPKRPGTFKRKARIYKCLLCGKSFHHPRNVFSHKRKKHGLFMRHSGRAAGGSIPTGMMGENETIGLLPNIKEEPGTNTDQEQMPRLEAMQENTGEDPEQNDNGACSESSDSDCGEPSHCFKVPKPPNTVEVDKSNSEESQMKEKMVDMHRQHKYWKWECFECDKGFDEMAGLHLHYIKHATGEIPMIQDDDMEA